MFTFKKYALIGVSALAALAISCSDDDGEEELKDLGDFDAGKIIPLYGASSNEGGSSAELDGSIEVYKLSEIPNVNEIDFVFDGTNAWTPVEIGKASVASLSAKYADASNSVVFFEVGSSVETANDLADAYTAEGPNGEDIVVYFDKKVLSNGTKFGVLTSDGNLALVKVNSLEAQVLKLEAKRTDG